MVLLSSQVTPSPPPNHSLKLFKNGAMEEYVQSRTFAAMEKYILEAGANTASIAGSASGAAGEPDEDNLIHGTNGNFASTIKFPGISFVKFYAPWCVMGIGQQ